MNVTLDNDKAVQQDEAQQAQHAHSIGHYYVSGDHGSAAEHTHSHLVRHKHNGPEHEEPAGSNSSLKRREKLNSVAMGKGLEVSVGVELGRPWRWGWV